MAEDFESGVYDLPNSIDPEPDIPKDSFDNIWEKGYGEQVSEICDNIDRNISYIQDSLGDIQASGNTEYFSALKEELDQISSNYEMYKNEAYVEQGQAMTEAQKQEKINNLMFILNWTNDVSSSLSGDQGDQDTQMVVSNGGQDGDVITMEEAGPVVAWWNGLSPSTRTLIKAAGIGFAIWGGKKAWGHFYRGMKNSQMNQSGV